MYLRKRNEILKNALEKWVTKSLYEFLKMEHPVTSVFYLLPKTHKSLESPPSRPIAAGNNLLSEPPGQFVDHFIKDTVKTLPSYVVDSGDVLKLVSDISMLENLFLDSLDMESLYTNILRYLK